MDASSEIAVPREQQGDALKRTRISYLAISAGALLVLGLVYAWSIFAVPLGGAYGWDRSLLSYVFSISMTSFCLGSLLSSFIIRKWTVRAAILVAAMLQASGFILISTMSAYGIWALYLFYGVFAGMGCGLGYNTIISTVNLWFPEKAGFASGVMMMGFGLGSLVLGTAANASIEAFGLSLTFMAIGLISATVLVLLSLVLKLPPENVEAVFGKARAKDGKVAVPVSVKPLLKTPLFYLFFLWAVLLFGALMTLMGDSKQGALILGVDTSSATLLVGLVSMMNGLARVVIGLLFDRTSLRVAMSTALVIGMVAIGSIACAFLWELPSLYYGAALFAGFAAGCVPVMSSLFARERFEAASYPKNLAIVNANIAFAALLSSVAVSIGRPLGGDAAVYVILFCVIVVALVDMLVFFRLYYRTQ